MSVAYARYYSHSYIYFYVHRQKKSRGKKQVSDTCCLLGVLNEKRRKKMSEMKNAAQKIKAESKSEKNRGKNVFLKIKKIKKLIKIWQW